MKTYTLEPKPLTKDGLNEALDVAYRFQLEGLLANLKPITLRDFTGRETGYRSHKVGGFYTSKSGIKQRAWWDTSYRAFIPSLKTSFSVVERTRIMFALFKENPRREFAFSLWGCEEQIDLTVTDEAGLVEANPKLQVLLYGINPFVDVEGYR